jgi:nucleoside-diphosphate-sugar epimerase
MKKTNKSKFTQPLIETEDQIEKVMTTPNPQVIKSISNLEGDIMVLGGGGKMGPTLTKLAKNCIESAKLKKKIISIDKYFSPQAQKDFKKRGIDFIQCDLLNNIDDLPEVQNVVFMAGMKFGTSGNSSLTWALNTYLPALAAKKFRKSKIVVFSSANVYHLTPVFFGGATEDTPPNPFGEYAQSVLGREKMFEYFSQIYNTRITIIRLAYAIDLRYGIILDIAQKIYSKIPIDVSMGHVNVIWQGDANAQILRSFELCSSPPAILNITGPETISIRWLSKRLGELMDIEPIFTGTESESALLFNASKALSLFGYPTVTLDCMIQWIANWVMKGGKTLKKPTHFEQRDGKF